MAQRTLMIVGLQLPWEHAEYVPINSRRSLSDGDVIVLYPSILSNFYAGDTYLGHPCYDDDTSFKIRESIAHWHNQTSAVLSAGKTVIAIASPKENFHIATGQREHSGTGRNRRTTRVVQPASNYQMLPLSLKDLQSATGKRFKRGKAIWPIERYWQIMGTYSQYSVTYQVENATALLTTPDSTRTLSSVLEGFIVLPDLIFPDNLEDEKEIDDDGSVIWTDEAREFAHRVEASFFAIDSDRADASAASQPPDWVSADQYRLPDEAKIEAEVTSISSRLHELHEAHQKRTAELQAYISVKALLYEKGARLEEAVITALRELGFHAQPYKTSDSEFDVVFSADGVRYLGEIEGRDDKAIHVDKISQLERNIQEDFQREDVNDYAVGVLFANAYRLSDVPKRGEFFTPKVQKAAKRTGIRLVKTSDLFAAVQTCRASVGATFAGLCRRAFRDQSGTIVQFPPGADAESTQEAVSTSGAETST